MSLQNSTTCNNSFLFSNYQPCHLSSIIIKKESKISSTCSLEVLARRTSQQQNPLTLSPSYKHVSLTGSTRTSGNPLFKTRQTYWLPFSLSLFFFILIFLKQMQQLQAHTVISWTMPMCCLPASYSTPKQ